MKSFIFTLLFFTFQVSAISQTFKSSDSRTQLLELYSSQGCSSCPPAERWFSRLKTNPDLWSKFIPLVFHVDYWDYLGWKDPFSNTKYSQRQRNYYSQKSINSVYTPAVLLNGQEWRGWYKTNQIKTHAGTSDILTAELKNNILSVNYSNKGTLVLNVALLGIGIKTDVLSGENSNHSFVEDFIVLSMQTRTSNNGTWTLPFKASSHFDAESHAIAIWVTSTDNLIPLQATGGLIVNE